MNAVWAQVFAILNAILGLGLVVFEICLFRRYKTARFIRILLIAIGAYWGGIYLYVALTDPVGRDAVYFGQVFVRPAFTFTLASMLATAIYRLRAP